MVKRSKEAVKRVREKREKLLAGELESEKPVKKVKANLKKTLEKIRKGETTPRKYPEPKQEKEMIEVDPGVFVEKGLEEKYNPEKEIEKLCKNNDIVFVKKHKQYEGIRSVGLLPILHNELNLFVERKERNGFHILGLVDPTTRAEYGVEISYMGNTEEKGDKENIEDDEDFLIRKIKYNSKGEICLDEEGNVIYSSIKVDIDTLADFIIEQDNFKTMYGEKSEKILYYNNKIFVKGARGLIKSKCERILKTYAKKNVVEEIFDKIKRKTKITPEEFEQTDLYLIPLENGCYDIKHKKLIPHSPKYNFTFLSPVEYNPKAKCPNWFKFIEETLYLNDVKVMQQWFGFNLFRQYFIKKSMILLGKKDTGKTVLLDTLIAFVGELNKSGLSIQKITTGSDFSKFALKGKLANIYDDLSSADINDGGSFKIATGGGFISAEEKFGDCVQFKTYAKQTLAGNKAPPVKDNDDDAYFSRFMPIIFDNVPEKKDPFLRDKLNTTEELSGILNWALKGLHKILKEGSFDFNKTDEEIKRVMEMSGDNLIQFGEGVLEQSNGKITKEEMYEIYCLWANENDKPLLSKEQLGRRLNQKVKYLIAKTDSKNRFWDNVTISDSWVEKTAEIFTKKNLRGKQDTLDTSTNITRKYSKTDIIDKNKINNDNENNIYKVGESVESVVNPKTNPNTLDTSFEDDGGKVEVVKFGDKKAKK